jgi:GC-rich sequence DNA-binding factor
VGCNAGQLFGGKGTSFSIFPSKQGVFRPSCETKTDGQFPLLEKIEADSMAHLQERADLVSNRRTADDNDDTALILGVPPQTDPDGIDEAAEEVDELGRSRRTEHESGPSSGVRKARRTDRSARRTRRRARAQTANGAAGAASGPGGDDEGFSTDSSLAEGDARDYSSAQHDLSRRVDALLDDVKAEDFRDPSKGLAVRFGGWRARYEDEYMGAFGALSMVQAWSFWARGEMVGWEPLRVCPFQDDGRSCEIIFRIIAPNTKKNEYRQSKLTEQSNTAIEEFTWFQAIHEYSHPRPTTNGQDGMDEDDEPPLGPDGDLNTQMVNDAVVPFLIKAFQSGAYDPYSAKQTRKAVDVLEVVQEMAGKDSRKFTVSPQSHAYFLVGTAAS